VKFAYENIRLNELAAIADLNKNFYDYFVEFLSKNGYLSLYEFIICDNEIKTFNVIEKYLSHKIGDKVFLYDGIARKYTEDKAKWLFLGWVLRDAPQQRLLPMVSSVEGISTTEKKSKILSIVKKGLRQSYSEPGHWTWFTTREVMIDRLEGSRRAIKGTLFEAIVRRVLSEEFEKNGLKIDIPVSEIKLQGETYDVSLKGNRASILMPVKTRETMGGGHALLFSRDIHKSISAAIDNGYLCVPVIIAESWGADISALNTEHSIYINKNPNQVANVEVMLRQKIIDLLPYFKSVCLE